MTPASTEVPGTPEGPHPEEREFATLRERLHEIDQMDTIGRAIGQETRKEAGKVLDEIERTLRRLAPQHAQDRDFQKLRTLYQDLRADFEKGVSHYLDIDAAADSIVSDAQSHIRQLGIRRIAPSEVPPGNLRGYIRRLQDNGVEPKYVVSISDEAPIAVLFMQEHGVGASMSDLAESSQKRIARYLEKLYGLELIDAVLDEGVEEFRLLSTLDAQSEDFRDAAAGLIKAKFPDVKVMGMDSATLKVTAMIEEEFFKPSQDRHPAFHRRKVFLPYSLYRNVVAADNTTLLQKQHGMQNMAIVFGALHEENVHDAFGKEKEHPLPFSNVLAAEGFNVVVVDGR